MNLLSKNRNLLIRSVTLLQQSSVYSTKITHTIEKSQHLTEKKISESDSSSFADRISKQTVRPKPIEIPYQGKVANSVNLIGYIKSPIQFETDSNGNHFAATVISQETNCATDPLLIPVVFEGDLAHVVAYHVKENNRVLVSGKLCWNPLRFAFSGCFMNFHIVADNLNFVGGFKRNFSRKFRGAFAGVGIEKRGDGKIDESIKIGDGGDGKIDESIKIGNGGDGKIDESIKIGDGGDGKSDELIKIGDSDMGGFNQKWIEALEYAKVKRWGDNLESKPEEHSDGREE